MRINRKALTLVELIVVLLVLTATAAIVVPRFGGVLTSAHGSTGASNIGETAKAVQLFEATRLRAPNNLCIPNHNVANTTYSFFEDDNGGTVHYGSVDLNVPANSGIVDALTDAGMTSLVTLDPTAATENATFGSEAGTAVDLANITTATNVLTLTDAGAAALGITPSAGAGVEFVVFGIGERSELIGTTMMDAPVHFPEAGGEDLPQNTYQRLFAIYRVGDGTNFAEKASFVGVFTNDEGNVAGINAHIAEFYEGQVQ